MKVINYDPEYISGITEIAEIKCISKKEKNTSLLRISIVVILIVCIIWFYIKSNVKYSYTFLAIATFVMMYRTANKVNLKNINNMNCLLEKAGINLTAIKYHKIVTENNVSKAGLSPSEKGKAVLHLYKEDGGLVVTSDEITFACVMKKGITEEILDVGNGVIYIPLLEETDREGATEIR